MVYLWLILIDAGQKITKFCKAVILQLKNKVVKKMNISLSLKCTIKKINASHNMGKFFAINGSISSLVFRIYMEMKTFKQTKKTQQSGEKQ